MCERLCVSIAVDGLEPRLPILIEPVRVTVLYGIELLLEYHRIGLVSRCVLSVPLTQCPIPHAPSRSAGAVEVVRLLRRRTQENFVRQLHRCLAFSIRFAHVLHPSATLRPEFFGSFSNNKNHLCLKFKLLFGRLACADSFLLVCANTSAHYL